MEDVVESEIVDVLENGLEDLSSSNKALNNTLKEELEQLNQTLSDGINDIISVLHEIKDAIKTIEA
jgi:hypothetical protein